MGSVSETPRSRTASPSPSTWCGGQSSVERVVRPGFQDTGFGQKIDAFVPAEPNVGRQINHIAGTNQADFSGLRSSWKEWIKGPERAARSIPVARGNVLPQRKPGGELHLQLRIARIRGDCSGGDIAGPERPELARELVVVVELAACTPPAGASLEPTVWRFSRPEP